MIDVSSITTFSRGWLKDQLSVIERELTQKVADPDILQELLTLPQTFAMNEEGEVTGGERALSLLEYGSAGFQVPAMHLCTRMRTVIEQQMVGELDEL